MLILGTIISDLKEYGYLDGDTAFKSLMFVLLSLIISFFIFLVGSIVFQSNPPDPINHETKTIETVNLVAVTDNTFIARYSSDNYYCYAYDTEFGIAFDKARATYSFIKYIDEGEQPYMVRTREYHNQFVYDMWGISADWYTFYIPEDSVIEDYAIDLE